MPVKLKRLSARLNKKISIQKKSVSGKGIDRGESWAVFCSDWASIRPISASEIIKSDREEMDISHRIKIRYRSGITSDMKIVYGSREFDIHSVININEANREIELLATEVVL